MAAKVRGFDFLSAAAREVTPRAGTALRSSVWKKVHGLEKKVHQSSDFHEGGSLRPPIP
jgi:hypothetical protein